MKDAKMADLMNSIMKKFDNLIALDNDKAMGDDRKLVILIMREMWVDVMTDGVDPSKIGLKSIERSQVGKHLARQAICKIFDKSHAMAEINPEMEACHAVFDDDKTGRAANKEDN